jgi:hypothetical protein
MSRSSWTLFFFHFSSSIWHHSFFCCGMPVNCTFYCLQSPSPSEKWCDESEPFLLCIRQLCVCVCVYSTSAFDTYIYIFVCVCVCVCTSRENCALDVYICRCIPVYYICMWHAHSTGRLGISFLTCVCVCVCVCVCACVCVCVGAIVGNTAKMS